ncbi:hypothetical protein ACFFTM_16230 [Pseudoduganella plicata]|uniref:Uncharacterized protein n=1 Tax=Pseudoduganella plicata TaxID=321984 RepID=A0A4V1AUG1_9BURK|nr:hypothetical protein [Pseudoduganella plicata]QBQ39048.1 hypothetical protein E1742_25050 [Pseudoduganella plicata]GGY86782.1 hypothetical protein GCM10007388_20090 [Pseudoduganella plicata]
MEYLVEQLYEDTGALPRFGLSRGSPGGAAALVADCGEQCPYRWVVSLPRRTAADWMRDT